MDLPGIAGFFAGFGVPVLHFFRVETQLIITSLDLKPESTVVGSYVRRVARITTVLLRPLSEKTGNFLLQVLTAIELYP